ncbi:hypothetical protein ABZ957_10860 [Streptomyces sp. NPDC046316]|uniref:hypothetical protein n=1 Tax=Streptomyces sp. NPDC046316 TaxID=3154494 RepID=UPI00341196DA
MTSPHESDHRPIGRRGGPPKAPARFPAGPCARFLTSRPRPARRPGAADGLRLGALGAWLTAEARSGETDAAFTARLTPSAQQAAADHDHLAEE